MRVDGDDFMDSVQRLEQLENELAAADGMNDIRERITDIRSDLVGSAIEKEFDALKKEFETAGTR